MWKSKPQVPNRARCGDERNPLGLVWPLAQRHQRLDKRMNDELEKITDIRKSNKLNKTNLMRSLFSMERSEVFQIKDMSKTCQWGLLDCDEVCIAPEW